MLGLCAGTALAGCGFQPVYRRTATGQAGPAQRNLAAISVDRIPDRPGQLLRQALQERFGSDADGAQHRYALAVSYRIAGEGISVQPDSVATRVRLIGYADWTLRTVNGGPGTITTGSARAIDGFDMLDQQYFASDLSTEQTQHRLASAMADQIALQLAVFFRHRASVASR
jgi:LPS-assembly lipoprotein